MNRVGSVALVVAVLCVSLAWGQERPSSAPWLGEEEYSIEFEGTLQDALSTLQELTGRRIAIPPARPRDPGTPPPPPVDMDQPITLQFEQTRLDEILLALCEQAEVVYGTPDISTIHLSPGNPALDPRPAEVVDQYVLRVTRVGIGLNTELHLRWGEPLPAASTMTDRLSVWLDVEAPSLEAFARLAGVDVGLRGTTDTGLVLTPDERMARRPGGVLTMLPSFGRPTVVTVPAQLSAPPEGPQMLTTLEGKLKLYSEVKMTQVRIEPDSAGRTFTEDDVTVTVRRWNHSHQRLVLDVEVKYPRLPIAPGETTVRVGDLHWALAVGGDGRELSARQSMMTRPPDADGTHPLSFTLPGRDVDHVRLIVARRGPADLEVPFVIRDIPLP